MGLSGLVWQIIGLSGTIGKQLTVGLLGLVWTIMGSRVWFGTLDFKIFLNFLPILLYRDSGYLQVPLE